MTTYRDNPTWISFHNDPSDRKPQPAPADNEQENTQ
jgi:hypothetical protein